MGFILNYSYKLLKMSMEQIVLMITYCRQCILAYL